MNNFGYCTQVVNPQAPAKAVMAMHPMQSLIEWPSLTLITVLIQDFDNIISGYGKQRHHVVAMIVAANAQLSAAFVGR